MTELLRAAGEAAAFVWGAPLLSAIGVTGLYLTVKTRFFQIRRLGAAIKTVFSPVRRRTGGAVSPFEAVCTALSATVGTGNIAGVAGAVAVGGPGAVFWMWVSALLGMIVKAAETALAVQYRERKNGEYAGGPMYTIKNGLPHAFFPLAALFSLFGTAAAFGSGNAVQVNTMAAAVRTALPPGSAQSRFDAALIVGVLTAVLTGAVLAGGISRIGRFAARAVPFMVLLYIGLSAGVIAVHADRLPAAVSAVFRGAFNPASVTGGAVTGVFIPVGKGTARGIFSNEAGLGTSAMAHAGADTDSPARQGLYGMFEVFADTLVICTLTAFVILCGAPVIRYGTDPGAALTLSCFSAVYGGGIRPVMAAVLCFFAFTSVVGWGFYGMRCVGFLLGAGAVRPFLYCFSAACVLGAVSDLRLVWSLSELFNGLMALPNLTAVLLLSPQAADLLRQKKAAHPPA